MEDNWQRMRKAMRVMADIQQYQLPLHCLGASTERHDGQLSHRWFEVDWRGPVGGDGCAREQCWRVLVVAIIAIGVGWGVVLLLTMGRCARRLRVELYDDGVARTF